MRRAHQPGDRTAVEGAARRCLEDIAAAAGIVHHEEAAAIPLLAHLVPGGGELGLHRALEIGVEHRRHRALVLAKLGDDLARQHHRQIADMIFLVFLADDLLDPALVLGVHERPQQRHHDGPRAAVDEVLEFAPHVLLVERTNDGPGRNRRARECRLSCFARSADAACSGPQDYAARQRAGHPPIARPGRSGSRPRAPR